MNNYMINKAYKKFKQLLLPSQLIVTINYFIARQTAWKRYRKSLADYQNLLSGRISSTSEGPEEVITLYPCIYDATNVTSIEPTYFYQDSWAFELIVKAKPNEHIDIGSHHKYVALLSKVVPVTMVDIRPLSLEMSSITFEKGSILALPFMDNSIASLSSLCVIEHIGLGRYGDPLDPDGSAKACRELARVIIPGGSLYISVPVEKHPTTYFNAHRSFNEDEFLRFFPEFSVMNKSYIYGSSFTCFLQDTFGTGCYHLIKSF